MHVHAQVHGLARNSSTISTCRLLAHTAGARFSRSILIVIAAVAFSILCLSAPADASAIWYVKHPPLIWPQGGTSGHSWSDPVPLEYALLNASAGDEIRVQEGTYIPTPPPSGDPREAAFSITKSLTLVGGYHGDETGQPLGCPGLTILSGDLNNNNPINLDNTYHVVTLKGAGAKVIINGFNIQHGKAENFSDPYNLLDPRNLGAGLYISSRMDVEISNVLFFDNSTDGIGAGIYCKGSLLHLKQDIFYNNPHNGNALGGGGGMYCANSTVRAANVVFQENGNNTANGGALFLTGAGDYQFANCVFFKNHASSGSGGAAYLADSCTPSFFNCSFGDNDSTSGAASSIDVSTLNPSGGCFLSNCVFFNATTGGKHFTLHPMGSTFTAASCYLYSVTGDPLPTDVSAPGFPNVGPPAYPSYIPVSLALHPTTPLSIREGGDPSLLPTDVTDLDNDGNTTELIPVDREGMPRITGIPGVLSMGAYASGYTQGDPALGYNNPSRCNP